MFPLIPRERGKEGRKKEGRGEEKRVGRKWRRGREGGREGRRGVGREGGREKSVGWVRSVSSHMFPDQDLI